MAKRILLGITLVAFLVCALAFAQARKVTNNTKIGVVQVKRAQPGVIKGKGERVIPWHINYQGYLTDNAGTPINGNLNMTFSIWTLSSGGSEVWSEGQVVSVEDGLFNVVLGGTPIPSSVFEPGESRWLQLVVEGQILLPRTEITSVGYAYRAVKADSTDYALDSDKVDNFDASATPGPNDLFPLSYGDGQYVNEGQADAIDSPMILDGTIQRADAEATFKAPYADTADYALAANVGYVDSAGVSANSWRLENNTLTDLDSRWVNEGQVDAIDSPMILNGTIQRADAEATFKAPYADTADYALAANVGYVDSAGVSANSWRLENNTLTDLDSRWVNEGQVDAIDNPMIVDGTILRADVDAAFKAPYADTADYALSAPVAPDGDWTIAGSVLHPSADYGLSMRSSNVLYGTNDNTHVNFGGACTTGTSGQNWPYCTVSGGFQNAASDDAATVGGGETNTASGSHATVGGGLSNIAGIRATVAGGQDNDASGTYATVCGGYYNTASGNRAFVGGGYEHLALGDYATVGGGQSNAATAQNATVGGGYADTASGEYATVGGGYDGTASNWYATVSGGLNNTASGHSAIVGGGWNNAASGTRATLGGGENNTASGVQATVGGGLSNTASQTGATVAGGWANNASAQYATVAGGLGNVASGYMATVGGGYSDTVQAPYGGVFSGRLNVAGDEAADTAAFVGGGRNNRATARFAAVAGGENNTASVWYTTVGGGQNNTASQTGATVSGGLDNTATGNRGTVGGGQNNSASGFYGTVGGGANNYASYYATVGGGLDNYVGAVGGNWYATVGGGRADTSAGDYSFTVGNSSLVPSAYSNSAAFNGQTATASGQTRVGTISKAAGSFTIDHPLNPMSKILNHYFVESPEMVLIYRGVARIGADGRAVVHLPDYFDALNRNPMVQLTGVGTSDVFVAEEVSGNRFVIGGKPGTKVYWTVTGDRKDPSAEITRIIMPVEQSKDGDLAGRSLDDDFLATTKTQLERMGEAGKFHFRTQAGREKYEASGRALENR